MKRIKQQRPGYYAALRQNRKILNKRLNNLDAEMDLLTGQKNRIHSEANKLAASKDSIKSIIKTVKKAGLWKRFLYFFTGDVKSLAAWKEN